MTDPSAANIFRCLGTIEPGQCTIILDEADKIDKSPEMMAILKTGYQLNGGPKNKYKHFETRVLFHIWSKDHYW